MANGIGAPSPRRSIAQDDHRPTFRRQRGATPAATPETSTPHPVVTVAHRVWDGAMAAGRPVGMFVDTLNSTHNTPLSPIAPANWLQSLNNSRSIDHLPPVDEATALRYWDARVRARENWNEAWERSSRGWQPALYGAITGLFSELGRALSGDAAVTDAVHLAVRATRSALLGGAMTQAMTCLLQMPIGKAVFMPLIVADRVTRDTAAAFTELQEGRADLLFVRAMRLLMLGLPPDAGTALLTGVFDLHNRAYALPVTAAARDLRLQQLATRPIQPAAVLGAVMGWAGPRSAPNHRHRFDAWQRFYGVRHDPFQREALFETWLTQYAGYLSRQGRNLVTRSFLQPGIATLPGTPLVLNPSGNAPDRAARALVSHLAQHPSPYDLPRMFALVPRPLREPTDDTDFMPVYRGLTDTQRRAVDAVCGKAADYLRANFDVDTFCLLRRAVRVALHAVQTGTPELREIVLAALEGQENACGDRAALLLNRIIHALWLAQTASIDDEAEKARELVVVGLTLTRLQTVAEQVRLASEVRAIERGAHNPEFVEDALKGLIFLRVAFGLPVLSARMLYAVVAQLSDDDFVRLVPQIADALPQSIQDHFSDTFQEWNSHVYGTLTDEELSTLVPGTPEWRTFCWTRATAAMRDLDFLRPAPPRES